MLEKLTDRVKYRFLNQEIQELGRAISQLDQQRESLGRLQLEIENQGWEILGGDKDEEFYNDKTKRDNIISLARIMATKNPNINRSVNVQADYIFAQGVQVKAKDGGPADELQAFWKYPENRKALTSHLVIHDLESELQTTGNLFFTFFQGNPTVVRRIDVSEMVEIYCDPEDRWSPWFYKRSRTKDNKAVVEWYPSIYIRKESKYSIPASYPDSDKPIIWDVPVYHVAINRLGKMKFGLPDVFPSLAWATAYKKFLENWATIMAAYARIAMQVSGIKNKDTAATFQGMLQTTVDSSNRIEGNPSPSAGSTFAGWGGVKMEAVKTAGATTPAEDGKPLLNMVASGVGLPNTFYGDASVGNYATAKTLDRPTELKFTNRQRMWSEVLATIAAFGISPENFWEVMDRLEVIFPEILERNVTDRVRAVVNAITGFGKPLNPDICPSKKFGVRLILQALKVENVEEVLNEFATIWGDDKVPPIPVKTGPTGAEDPSQGGAVGNNG